MYAFVNWSPYKTSLHDQSQPLRDLVFPSSISCLKLKLKSVKNGSLSFDSIRTKISAVAVVLNCRWGLKEIDTFNHEETLFMMKIYEYVSKERKKLFSLATTRIRARCIFWSIVSNYTKALQVASRCTTYQNQTMKSASRSQARHFKALRQGSKRAWKKIAPDYLSYKMLAK